MTESLTGWAEPTWNLPIESVFCVANEMTREPVNHQSEGDRLGIVQNLPEVI
jgi:hypothetical protein